MFHELLLPYLYHFNELALVGLTSLKPLLDQEVVQKFYREAPLFFSRLIETREPFIEMPRGTPFCSFQPRPAPENYFRFAAIESFASGFDLGQRATFPEASRTRLCSEPVTAVVDLLVKAAGSDMDLFAAWPEGFDVLFRERRKSPFFFDYLGLCVKCWVEIKPCEKIRIPDGLFDPEFLVKDNPPWLFSMRFFAISCLLDTTEANIDQLLLSLVQFPLLFSEAVEICILQLPHLSKLIERNSRFIRKVRLMAQQLQYEDLAGELTEEFRAEIEAGRLSLFRLFFHVFQEPRYLGKFLSDPVFIPFCVSLLYEPKVRSFVLMEIRSYMSGTIEQTIFQNAIIQLFEQVSLFIPDPRALQLESELLASINRTKNAISLFPGRRTCFRLKYKH